LGSINDDGFLSGEISGFVSAGRSQHPEWVSLAADMNRFAMGMLHRVSIDRGPLPPPKKLYSAAYLGRVPGAENGAAPAVRGPGR
jgi:hypothetical protein